MKLRDFDYWTRWRLNRHGLQDFDVWLYPATSPLGFFQPGARAIAMSTPYVLLCSWSAVQDTVAHEISHALTDGQEKDPHGERWASMARGIGGWYRDDIYNPSPEFWEFDHWYSSEANNSQRSFDELITKALALDMIEETENRSAHYVGRLRLDLVKPK
jgi:hypothetical protein